MFILLIALALIILFFVLKQLKKTTLLKPSAQTLGKKVSIQKEDFQIYIEGSGSNTLVFLAGSDCLAPILDLKPLYHLLAAHYRIVVIEKPGYGFNTGQRTSTNLEQLISNYRRLLEEQEIYEPYILMVYDTAGIEALYWAQKYPNDIKALVGLDMYVPNTYNPLVETPKLKQFSRKHQFKKLELLNLAQDETTPFINPSLTPEEQQLLVHLVQQNQYNDQVLEDLKVLPNFISELNKLNPCLELPTYFFISNGQHTGYPNWNLPLVNYLGKIKKGQYSLLDVPHDLYHYEPKLIATQTHSFIQSL